MNKRDKMRVWEREREGTCGCITRRDWYFVVLISIKDGFWLRSINNLWINIYSSVIRKIKNKNWIFWLKRIKDLIFVLLLLWRLWRLLLLWMLLVVVAVIVIVIVNLRVWESCLVWEVQYKDFPVLVAFSVLCSLQKEKKKKQRIASFSSSFCSEW
jgi:hypothetical protein